jgi:hypothetical protein
MKPVSLEQVEALARQLSVDDQVALLRWLAEMVRHSAAGEVPRKLRGVFSGMFPENIELDNFLHEVRTDWEKEWTEDGGFVG